LWRNWRRSLIAMSAVAFAITLSIVQRGMQYGTYAETIRTAVRVSTGYLQVQKEGYNKNPTLQKSFVMIPQIERALRDTLNIDGSSPRIEADALLSYRDQSFGVMIMGSRPQKRRMRSTEFSPENKEAGDSLMRTTAKTAMRSPKLSSATSSCRI